MKQRILMFLVVVAGTAGLSPRRGWPYEPTTHPCGIPSFPAATTKRVRICYA